MTHWWSLLSPVRVTAQEVRLIPLLTYFKPCFLCSEGLWRDRWGRRPLCSCRVGRLGSSSTSRWRLSSYSNECSLLLNTDRIANMCMSTHEYIFHLCLSTNQISGASGLGGVVSLGGAAIARTSCMFPFCRFNKPFYQTIQ